MNSRSRSPKKTEKLENKTSNKTSTDKRVECVTNINHTPENSPPRKISKLNDINDIPKSKFENNTEKQEIIPKCVPEKRSVSRDSKSSSLSYSPARRSPNRYADVLENLSEKDKSKYIQPHSKKSNEHRTNDSKKAKSSKKLAPQPVVHLRASSSEGDSSSEQRDVSKVDDEDDIKIKELDLLNSGLAAIAKESVEKKRLQQIAKEDVNLKNPQQKYLSVQNNSTIPPKESNLSASSESMDISPENKNLQTTDVPIKTALINTKSEKAKLKSELKRRRLQTPDTTRFTKSRSRCHSSSSASSVSSAYVYHFLI